MHHLPFIRLIGFIALLCLVQNCANITRPSGGPKDETPPKLDPSNSTPNLQTNFKKQAIILAFDEWLKLNSPVTQVVVTPPLDYKFDLSLKKQNVIFKFDDREVLKENATYIINFGEAVKDLNEGNTVPDLRFVFSTGPFIDSLEVTGRIVDAVSGEPVTETLVLLYDQLEDSVFRTSRPFYFSKTDKTGNFKIENVRADTFKVCALKNDNLNYLYDQLNEEIGFIEAPIIVSDSTSPDLKIYLFKEEEPLRLIDSDNSVYGLLKLIFNQPPRNLDITWSNQGKQAEYLEPAQDTIKIWYATGDSSRWSVYLKQDSTFMDTLVVKGPTRRSVSILKDTLRPLSTPTGEFVKINPNLPLRFEFNHPIASLDSSLFRLSPDSSSSPLLPFTLALDSSSKKVVLLNHPWKEDSTYTLQILPNAVTDLYGMTNDSLTYNYNILARSAVYGSLKLNLSQLDSNKAYILQLLYKGSNLVGERTVAGDTIAEVFYPSLPSGEYSVKIIEDLNQNGRWDTGNYDLKKQPERQMLRELEKLLADWEVDAEIKVEESLPRY